MRKFILAAMVVTGLLQFTSTPASALNNRSYVASGGSDGNDCSRAHPCAGFDTAITKTAPNGEVVCLDSGEYGQALISGPVTIICEAGLGANQGAGSLTLGEFFVNIGAGQRVALRGLTLDLGTTVNTHSSVDFYGAGTLILEHCNITGGGGSAQNAVYFRPNGPSKLVISNSIISGSGNGSAGAGVRIAPASGGTAQVTIADTMITGNTFGIAVDGNSSTGGINASIVDSKIASNTQDGIVATSSSGGAPVGVYVRNSQSLNNAIGIRAIGSNVTVRVDGSSVIGNSTGVTSLSGGNLLTFGNNSVRANGSDGAFTGSVALQ